MKKNVTVITLLLLIIGMLSGCGHQHVWKEATCTEPKTCTECGETEGSPLGHTWTAATCTAPKTCNVCGETEGIALAHTWIEATCTTPKTCSVCGETEGELTEHDLDSTGKCTVCSAQIGYALNSSNYKQYLNITFKTETIDSPYDLFDGQKLTVNVEPIKNVNFENVRINYVYTEYISGYYLFNGKPREDQELTGSVKLDSAGYGSASSSSSFWIKNYKFKDISGYIIE